jgi:LysM repeat protein
MRARVIAFLLLWIMLLAPALPVTAAPIKQPNLAPAFSDGYALVDAVNQLRAANGLPAYQINIALTISAQLHSEYQASIGTWSHEGSGGTDESQRAAAQGYGSGASFMCDEAVGFGYQYTAQKMVEMWNEPTHAPIMLSSRYIDVGGGAAIDAEGRIFYTLDVCVISGQSAVVSGTGADTLQATVEPFSGIQTATPQPDGSIIHEVQAGESFFSVADLYDLTLDELLTMNNLTEAALIFPGDLLKVREPLPPTPSPVPSFTPTPVIPTATRRPTRTPTSPPQPSATSLPTATPTPEQLLKMPDTATFMDRGLPAISAGLAATGVVMILVGSLLKRRRP